MKVVAPGAQQVSSARLAATIGWPAVPALAFAGLLLVLVGYRGTEHELQLWFAVLAALFTLGSGVLLGGAFVVYTYEKGAR